MVVLAVDGAGRALRMAPVGARHEAPPAAVVAQRDFLFGAGEDHGAGNQGGVDGARRARWQLHRQVFPAGLAFSGGDITGGVDEAAEFRIGDVVGVHPETREPHPVRRPLIGLRHAMVVAHQEFAGGHPGHALGAVLAVAHPGDALLRGGGCGGAGDVAAQRGGRDDDGRDRQTDLHLLFHVTSPNCCQNGTPSRRAKRGTTKLPDRTDW